MVSGKSENTMNAKLHFQRNEPAKRKQSSTARPAQLLPSRESKANVKFPVIKMNFYHLILTHLQRLLLA